MEITTDVMKIAKAVENLIPSGVANKLFADAIVSTTKEDTMIPMIPIPEIGLAEVPIKPAI